VPDYPPSPEERKRIMKSNAKARKKLEEQDDAAMDVQDAAEDAAHGKGDNGKGGDKKPKRRR
jgi:hypothetical protein